MPTSPAMIRLAVIPGFAPLLLARNMMPPERTCSVEVPEAALAAKSRRSPVMKSALTSNVTPSLMVRSAVDSRTRAVGVRTFAARAPPAV